NQWWTAVQIRHHVNRIAKLEWEKDGAWINVDRVDYNYFVEANGMGPGPYHFRVTDIFGHTLEDTGIGFIEGGVVDGKGQFPPCQGDVAPRSGRSRPPPRPPPPTPSRPRPRPRPRLRRHCPPRRQNRRPCCRRSSCRTSAVSSGRSREADRTRPH